MAKKFFLSGWNVVINGLNPERLQSSLDNLRKLESISKVESYVGNVSTEKEIQGLVDFTVKKFKKIDIWINNAGINQPPKPIWELNEKEIDSILNTNLKGTIIGTRLATIQMQKQPNGGYIYNMEGFGSNDYMKLGYNMYGTSKRALTYFTQAYAKELEEKNSKVKIGRLSPGVVITDFLVKPLGGEKEIQLTEKEKNFYNIVGDYPDVVAEYLVDSMIINTTNNAHIEYLTKSLISWRFLTSWFYKRNFFK
jgi:NAD(P)-dependent dehydrogenase (short-subunit alcohol dehydrogenase family)